MARELAGPRLRFNANPRPDNANNRSISTQARLIRQLGFNVEGMRKINRRIDIRMGMELYNCYIGDFVSHIVWFRIIYEVNFKISS